MTGRSNIRDISFARADCTGQPDVKLIVVAHFFGTLRINRCGGHGGDEVRKREKREGSESVWVRYQRICFTCGRERVRTENDNDEDEDYIHTSSLSYAENRFVEVHSPPSRELDSFRLANTETESSDLRHTHRNALSVAERSADTPV